MPSKRSSSPSFGCLLVSFTVAFILSVTAIVALLGIPIQVEESFGPASPRLSSTQRWVLTLQIWMQRQELTTPVSPIGSEQTFRVDAGESVASIAGHLQQQGLIASAKTFRLYLLYTGLDISLQAGEYILSPVMTSVEIALAMQDATPATVPFAVLAGWRMEEIAATLPTSGLNITPDDFLQTARKRPSSYAFTDGLPGNISGEGFLFPGVYEMSRQANVEELLDTLYRAFDANLSADLRQGFTNQGLSLHEAVTLASISQREAIQKDEMPLITSVFYNRLAAGMNLSTDPSVQYALGYNTAQSTWWTNPLTLENLQMDSPYNTYHNTGLPPGPICSPGLEALHAVANPAQSPYYFFRAACDGSGRHSFAVTFEEHQANACP